MPTLAGIQGSSLLTPFDISGESAQASTDWENVRMARERAQMSQAIKDMAAASAGATTAPGAAAAPAPVTGGAAPSAPGTPQMRQQGGMGGGLIPDAAIERLMAVGGTQGVGAANKLIEMQTRQRTAQMQQQAAQVQSLGAIAGALMQQDQGAQDATLRYLQSQPDLTPSQRRFVEQMLPLNKDQRDPLLQMTGDRSLSRLEQINAGIDALKANTERRKANTAASRLAYETGAGRDLEERKVAATEARIDQDIREFNSLDETEQRKVAGRVAEPILEQAEATIVGSTELLSLIGRTRTLAEELEDFQGGSVPLGLRNRLSSIAAQVSPDFAESIRQELGTAGGLDSAALDNLTAQILQARLASIQKGGQWSNADQEALARSLPSGRASSTAQLLRQLDETERTVRGIYNNAVNVTDTFAKPESEGGGAMGVIRAGKQQRDTRNAETYPDAPPIGTQENGYEYLGGDPARPASWRKVGA